MPKSIKSNGSKDLELDAQRDEAMRGLEASRQMWAEKEGKALANKITEAVSQLETNIAASVAEILKPFLYPFVLDQALDELRHAISIIITNNKNVQLKIAGPDDLIGKVKSHFPGIEIVPVKDRDGLAVVVEAGDTVIETNVAAWFEKLEEFCRA
jgi:hypothetical protein